MSIVNAQWLKAHLGDDNVRLVDASWHLPAAKRNAREDFERAHIPGAVFFDIDEHAAASPLPHMLPDAGQFAQAAGSLGIARCNTIVVYDSVGMFSAARVWWMFRHFGATDVYVLDGGLPAWMREGGEVETQADNVVSDNALTQSGGAPSLSTTRSSQTETTPSSTDSAGLQFQIEADQLRPATEVADAQRVMAAMHDGSVILDARSAGRFSGKEKEAREGLRSGHIPGSLNLPFTQVLDAQGCFKSVAQLSQLFDNLGLQKTDQLITSCGSGVTAAILLLALEHAGYQQVALYDGSWTEWGALDGVPVATG